MPSDAFGAIWVEKYRPQVLKDVEGSDAVLGRLKSMVSEANLQHILVAGPPGTGKTTSVMCIARELLGQERLKECVKELNASDERGVDVVRQTIKDFAKKSVTGSLPPGRHKIVILDEVDSMTGAAQQALRRIMEIYSATTRFALICNDSTKVIEPIQSRCVIIRFGKLHEDKILQRLLRICALEKLTYDDDGLKTLIFTADGDLRSAINNLQSTAQGFEGVINKTNVLKVCDIPSPDTVGRILKRCLAQDWRGAIDIASSLVEEGYTGSDIVAVLKSLLKKDRSINEHLALESLLTLGESATILADGNTSVLQLNKVLVSICQLASVTQ